MDPQNTPPGQPQPLPGGTRTTKLRERVLDQVRTDISTGIITEGTVLSAPTIARTLGVSTTPVREAMMDLVTDGLVEAVKNTGFRVTHMSSAALDHLTQVRLMLEPPAMHLIDATTIAAHHHALTQHADACTAAAHAHDLHEYLRHDRKFHTALLSCTGNPELVTLAANLRVRTRMYGLAALVNTRQLALAAHEHHQLITLLHQGDTATAETLLATHISHARGKWATGIAAPQAD